MYISYQFLIAMENDRLGSPEPRRLRQDAARGRVTRRDRSPRRAITRAFRARPAAGQAL